MIWDHVGPGGGLFPLKRCVWQTKALCILNTDVPESEAIAWLEMLPDTEEYNVITATLPSGDNASFTQCFGLHIYQTIWIARAYEKVGLHEGAFGKIVRITVLLVVRALFSASMLTC